jgi:hypothetical protein
VAQVVGGLPHNLEALISSPSTAIKQNKKRKRKKKTKKSTGRGGIQTNMEQNKQTNTF